MLERSQQKHYLGLKLVTKAVSLSKNIKEKSTMWTYLLHKIETEYCHFIG